MLSEKVETEVEVEDLLLAHEIAGGLRPLQGVPLDLVGAAALDQRAVEAAAVRDQGGIEKDPHHVADLLLHHHRPGLGHRNLIVKRSIKRLEKRKTKMAKVMRSDINFFLLWIVI